MWRPRDFRWFGLGKSRIYLSLPQDSDDVELASSGAAFSGSRAVPEDLESLPEYKRHARLLRAMLPYMWPKKGEGALKRNLVLAFLFLFTFKATGMMIPFAYKHAVDSLTSRKFPLKEIVAYATLQVAQSASREAKDNCFNLVTALTQRIISQRVLKKVCALSVRWHLMRKTGAVLKAMSRGSASLSDFVRFITQQLVPIIVETVVVCIIFLTLFRPEFSVVVVVVIVVYIAFTVKVTNWRNEHRRVQTKQDDAFQQKAMDVLLNFETIKVFHSEEFEAGAFRDALVQLQKSNILVQQSISVLNLGQNIIIVCGSFSLMLLAAHEVVEGRMTVGDYVLVLTFLQQLYGPLNYLGTYYRLIKQALVDVEALHKLLEENIEVNDADGAIELLGTSSTGKAGKATTAISFNKVTFGYDPRREAILNGISFDVPLGSKLAIVGPTGAGKSTMSRLVYRFYDVWEGSVSVCGLDVRDVTQLTLRRVLGIVPQDTVLFNETLHLNISYGRAGFDDGVEQARMHAKKGPNLRLIPTLQQLRERRGKKATGGGAGGSTAKEDDSKWIDERLAPRSVVEEAASVAKLTDFIAKLPDGYETVVGERGLRLSGGEKQRTSIARVVVKNPEICVYDEATSSLDTHTEREVVAAINSIASSGKYAASLSVAHRLSTVVDSDIILVLSGGVIAERGTHEELLEMDGTYAGMWQAQNSSNSSSANLSNES